MEETQASCGALLWVGGHLLDDRRGAGQESSRLDSSRQSGHGLPTSSRASKPLGMAFKALHVSPFLASSGFSSILISVLLSFYPT